MSTAQTYRQHHRLSSSFQLLLHCLPPRSRSNACHQAIAPHCPPELTGGSSQGPPQALKRTGPLQCWAAPPWGLDPPTPQNRDSITPAGPQSLHRGADNPPAMPARPQHARWGSRALALSSCGPALSIRSARPQSSGQEPPK
ncbi:hypothetical protein NDU88_001430 [Pleurodeles waltl]|uniref:Uncharacterized protein n=1 Tax=Pleurodeles waltl TaxID=8319 RepID=A0AAV7UTB6_PLEWA|nr:hypothetical protein NDU88_001430 [Pleurodeles waltl]